MRFRWEPNSFGRSGLVALPERGDVRPVFDELWLDHVVDDVDAGRFAAAAALTFYAEAGSSFKVPDPISPAAAHAIEALDPTAKGESTSCLPRRWPASAVKPFLSCVRTTPAAPSTTSVGSSVAWRSTSFVPNASPAAC